ncbi:MAG: adenylate kinase family protein [Sulfolobales archaeon]
MCYVIGVSGTPGVGKSYVARRLAELLGGVYIDLSQKVVEERLYQSYDSDRESYIADPEKVSEYIRRVCNENRGRHVVVDSHYAEIIDPAVIYRLFVLRTDPRRIAERLCRRGWSHSKIIENLEAEILGVCLYNAVEEQDPFKVCELLVEDLDRVVERILDILSGREKCEILYIDWLSILENKTPEEIVREVCSERS